MGSLGMVNAVTTAPVSVGRWGKVSDINRTRVGHHPKTRRRSTDDETPEINRSNTALLAGGAGLEPATS
jgi:hypothetical protein